MNPLAIIGAQAGGNILGGFLNSRYQRKQQERQFDHNKQMARYAFDRNVDMWNMQNEYNTPAKQMERFKEGGLNPHLIYGKGTPGNASELPKYQAPKAEYTSQPPFSVLPNMLGQFQDFKVKDAQIDLLNAQKKRTDEMTLTESVNRMLKTNQASNIGFKNVRLKELNKYITEDVQLDLEKKRLGNTLTELNTHFTGDKRKWFNRHQPLDIGLKGQELQLGKEKVEQAQWDTKWYREGLRPTDALWARMLHKHLIRNGGLQKMIDMWQGIDAKKIKGWNNFKGKAKAYPGQKLKNAITKSREETNFIEYMIKKWLKIPY